MVAEGIQDAADLDAADLVEQLEGMGVHLVTREQWTGWDAACAIR